MGQRSLLLQPSPWVVTIYSFQILFNTFIEKTDTVLGIGQVQDVTLFLHAAFLLPAATPNTFPRHLLPYP